MKKSSLIFLVYALAIGSPALRADPSSPTPTPADNSLKNIPSEELAPASAGVDDVAKLAKSGISESVVLSYVKNSNVAYQPSAEEIIKLKDQGVSSDVITAMINRGGELRAQGVTTTTPPSSSASYTAPETAPAQTTTTSYTSPVYTYASPSVVYVGTSYPTYPYPYWGGYYYWGGYWGPHYYYGPRYCGYYGGYHGGGFVAVNHSSASFHGGGGFHASGGGHHH